MISREGNRDKTVYVLPIFEIEANLKLPNKKSDLVDLIQNSSVIVFHKNFCAACHTVPQFNEWLKNQQSKEGTKDQTISKQIMVFSILQKNEQDHFLVYKIRRRSSINAIL